ncbi:MAG: hypothetical protein ABSG68_25060, partial [Thermoguttaceae bacterium]
MAGTQLERSDEARRVLLGEGLACEAEDVVAYDDLPACLASGHPDLVLVYCNGPPCEGLKAIQTAHQLVRVPILAIGEPAVALVRDAMRAGAREFLDMNNLRQDLSAALVNIESTGGGGSQRGKIVSVFSPIGGAGVSTIAVNLAVTLAGSDRPETADAAALIDVNPPPSDLSLLLDLEPKHTLAEVCSHGGHMDRKMLAGAMTAHASGLQVLPQPGYPGEVKAHYAEPDAAVLRQLFVLLRRMYATVIVDAGHALAGAPLEAVQVSSLVILVAHADVPGLRRAGWALDTLESLGVGRDRIRLVLNRYGERHQVKRATIEEALGLPVAWTLADNAALVCRARNEGVPLA